MEFDTGPPAIDLGVTRGINPSFDDSLHEHLSAEVRIPIEQSRGPDRSDSNELAPEDLGDRLLQVSKDGFAKAPEAFKHSLNPGNILPSVTIGFGLGAAMKLPLPPVAKAAIGVVGLAAFSEPFVNSYSKAIRADTMADMNEASSILGDALGGMPVTIAGAGLGATLGSRVAGRAFSQVSRHPASEVTASPSPTPSPLPAKLAEVTRLSDRTRSKSNSDQPEIAVPLGEIPDIPLNQLPFRNPDSLPKLKTVVSREGKSSSSESTKAGDSPSSRVGTKPSTESNATTKSDFHARRGDSSPFMALPKFADEIGSKTWETPAIIWHEATKASGGKGDPTFSQFAGHTINAARKLGHEDVIPSLQKAWKDVGVVPFDSKGT